MNDDDWRRRGNAGEIAVCINGELIWTNPEIDLRKYEIMGNVGAHNYSGEELPPTPRRIDAILIPGNTTVSATCRPKIIPAEIKFTSEDGMSGIRYKDGVEIAFDESAYYKTDQLDWIINCLQQLKEMIK